MPIFDMIFARPRSKACSRFASPFSGLRLRRGFQREPGTDRARAHAQQHGGVMQVAAVAGFDGEPNAGADAGANERVMHGSRGQRHGDGNASARRQTRSVSSRTAAPPRTRSIALAQRSSSAVIRLQAGLKTHSSTASGRLLGETVAGVREAILHLRKRKERRRQREAGERRALVQHMRPRTEAGVQLDDAGFAQWSRSADW